MGGAIADSVTHSQTFDSDFRSLEIELGTSHRKTHILPNHSSYEKSTPFFPLSVHPDCSFLPAHIAKQKPWDFYMSTEAFFFPPTISLEWFPLQQDSSRDVYLNVSCLSEKPFY